MYDDNVLDNSPSAIIAHEKVKVGHVSYNVDEKVFRLNK